MESDIAGKVMRTVADAAGVAPDRITLETALADLGIDSLAAIRIISDLEEAFGIVVPDEDVVRIRTVGQAIASLERVVGGKGNHA